MQEKFSITEVAMLRGELRKRDLDSLQIAEQIKAFLAVHGYGISLETAQEVAAHLRDLSCSVESLQRHLGTLALVM